MLKSEDLSLNRCGTRCGNRCRNGCGMSGELEPKVADPERQPGQDSMLGQAINADQDANQDCQGNQDQNAHEQAVKIISRIVCQSRVQVIAVVVQKSLPSWR